VINTVISKENIENNFHGLKELIKIAEKFKCKLNFSVLYKDQFNTKSNHNERELEEIIPSLEEKIKALNFLKKIKKERANFIMFSDPCIESLKESKNWKPCYSGILFCDLFPDGKVVNCLFKEEQGINGLKVGFKEAFEKLPKYENCSCPSTCYNELNCIFSLKPKAIVENFLKYITYVN
jgi:molybdenum cofactor biosynthesis enzyme MoaA